MSLIGIVAILSLSVLLTGIFVYGLRTKGPWGSSWSFFMVIVLMLGTVTLWVPPAGPVWYGAPWIDLLITGLLVSFILSAVTPSGQYQKSTNSDKFNSEEKIANAAYADVRKPAKASKILARASGFFWVLLVVLGGLIIIGAV